MIYILEDFRGQKKKKKKKKQPRSELSHEFTKSRHKSHVTVSNPHAVGSLFYCLSRSSDFYRFTSHSPWKTSPTTNCIRRTGN